jgi:uncharacterized protein (TIRG00374 family)
MKRPLRVSAILLVTGLCAAYLIWKIDLSETVDIVRDASLADLAGAAAIMILTIIPLAWRWQLLLGARGIRDGLGWLTRAYFVSYTAGQILPTAIGGDALRIYESARRHEGKTGDLAGIVLLERALGGVATLALAAVGFALAVGHYDVGAYLWIEALFVVGTILLAFVLFSRRVRRPLRRAVPLLRRLKLERPLRALYEGIHIFRHHAGLLAGVTVLTLVVQAVRVLAIWLAGRAAGVDLSPRIYYVMGPMLFLVLLIPFTINGFAVREAFFVSFLGTVGVDADAAFATGFLFFLVTLLMSVPGGVVLAWEGLRGPARHSVPDG